MTARSAVVALAAMSAVALPPQASPPRPPAPQQPTFRASADVVSVDVSVRERSRVVTGLGPSDFVVLDNGVPQAIADLSYGTLPIDVTVVLDVSVSVTGSLLDQLRWATRELMRDLRREDRLKLILFNTRVSRAVDFTTDISVVEAAIGKATAGGGTSAWDAIAVAMVSAASIDRRQLIVVFTDAADTASTTLPEDLFDIAHRTTASVASVIPAATYAATNIAGTSIVRSLRTVNTAGVEVLQKLAAETGGTQLRVSGAADLGASFRRVLDDFRSSYVLHFVPQGVERAGFHTLEVRLTDRKDVTIRARRGYYWR